MVLHVYWRKQCWIAYVCSSWSHNEWQTCLSLPTAFLTNAVFCRLVKNAVGKERQADHFPSMELTMSISTVCAILEDMGYHKVCSQWVPCLLRHIQTAVNLDTAGKLAVITQWGWCFSVMECVGQWDVVLPLWTKRETSRYAMTSSHCTLNEEIQVTDTHW